MKISPYSSSDKNENNSTDNDSFFIFNYAIHGKVMKINGYFLLLNSHTTPIIAQLSVEYTFLAGTKNGNSECFFSNNS
jgi:hypothetical protein